MNKHKSTIDFAVIGLGRFGFALAQSLAKTGKEVLVLDTQADKVNAIKETVEHAFIAKQLDKAALQEAGIQNCETVIVCISGEGLESSILTTLNVIDLGVPRVIAKAMSQEHGCVLQRIGAQVVYPEKDMAIRLSHTLVESKILDYISLSQDTSIAEIKVGKQYNNVSVLQSEIRKKYHLNIVAVIKQDKVISDVTPDTILNEGNFVIVIGTNDHISKFEKVMGNHV